MEFFGFCRSDVFEGVGEPFPGVIAQYLAGAEQRVHHGGTLAGFFRAAVQVGFLAHHHGADFAIDFVGFYFDRKSAKSSGGVQDGVHRKLTF